MIFTSCSDKVDTRNLYTFTKKHDRLFPRYHIPIESVLESTTRGLALDYIELVTKWVYNAPEGKDI